MKTADAVRRFQLMNGLTPDGIYGPKTKAKISAVFYSIQGLRQDNIYGPKTKEKIDSLLK